MLKSDEMRRMEVEEMKIDGATEVKIKDLNVMVM